ncbi:MAG: GDP-mannose 4,6-dehydratase [Candidatus Marinimicrobia bacterium]|nr:GDP-mannose 4,6-dehydratase [Candidatus Neomarinimicrobiota bacterium]
MNAVIIVGSKGQDGQLLKEFLQLSNYPMIGLDIDSVYSTSSLWKEKVDISSFLQVSQLIKQVKPSQVYYLAAHHHSSEDQLGDLSDLVEKSYKVNVFSYLNFLESIRRFSLDTKIFYAASSHIFGNPQDSLQDESTEFNPKSIYAITKLDGLLLSRFYRDNYPVFSSVGILYSHESPFRKNSFVSKKIVKTAVEIKKGLSHKLLIGDINAQMDWGFAGDYVKAMLKILDHDKPEDFIIATGKTIQLKDFISIVFDYLNLDWKKFVRESPELLIRKTKSPLCGNPSKLMDETGWKPTMNLTGLAKLMVDYELERIQS